ncbi:DNA repair protein RecN [Fulvivirga sp. RKSG066]|uniref:DNA repair protein RecN n=1 Tax=Fulvivirga aurantia TaxID=2529383 RepID=UPI0012BC7614|nr:DNA repair protein RecN [Fulvivirga aurantia]MTI20169.1 DNA repair protein RecN [Fulvivirga aurantia]
MLTHLLIKNYALIEHLELSPSRYLNIITGETGAGKSIILGAVGLLLGNRADTKTLYNEDSKCVIEGHFDLSAYKLKKVFEEADLDYEQTSIFRREISPSGKSRAFINDTPVTLDVIKKIGVHLMDVHSQHETLNLGKSNFQLAFIDAFANTTTDRKSYAQAFKKYKDAESRLQTLKSEASQIRQEADYNNFLLEELTKVELQADEQETLEENVKLSEHAEEIKSKLNEILEVTSNSEFAANVALEQAKNIFSQLSKYAEKYGTLSERMQSLFIELNDIISETEKLEEEIEFDPEETLRLQDRLSLIYSLQQKHGVSDIESLIEIRDTLAAKAEKFVNIDDEIEQTEQEVTTLKKEAEALAQTLSKKRKKAFPAIEKELTTLLTKVGIPDATLVIEHTLSQMTSHGVDDVNMLFSANKGIKPQPLSKVASGGEYSRLLFCVKFLLADKISLPTIIFDEIDTGVSGEIALKLGDMMKKMAQNHQVISISHLPQVAAKGTSHYFVYKDNSRDKSVSKIRKLSEDDRITEIAKMIGGEKPSDVAFQSAKELMAS